MSSREEVFLTHVLLEIDLRTIAYNSASQTGVRNMAQRDGAGGWEVSLHHVMEGVVLPAKIFKFYLTGFQNGFSVPLRDVLLKISITSICAFY